MLVYTLSYSGVAASSWYMFVRSVNVRAACSHSESVRMSVPSGHLSSALVGAADIVV
tara:strand:- start:11814 stop:11984 length:171 start_codon:yes stop_codon:yes gene_type:complete